MLLQVQTDCATFLFLEACQSTSEALIGQWLEIKGEKMGVPQLIGKRARLPHVWSTQLGDGIENDDRGLVAINRVRKQRWRGQLAAFFKAAGNV